MDVLKTFKGTAAATLVCALASNAHAAGGMIGINFTDLGDDSDHVGSAISAGVNNGTHNFAQTNWNNVDGNNGSITTAVDSNASSVAGLSVSWTSANTWRANNDATLSGDHTLMKGYIDDGQGVNITISNIPYASFQVVVYGNTDNGNFGSIYSEIDGHRASANTFANRTDAFGTANPFEYHYAENGASTTTVADLSQTQNGNYTILKGAEGHDSINIRSFRQNVTGGHYRGTIAAIQIIEIDPGTGLVLGDFNDDGTADVDDYNIWRANYGTAGALGDGDANYDGTVDFTDFLILRKSALATSGVSLVAEIPEPASLAILAIGGAAIIRRKRA